MAIWNSPVPHFRFASTMVFNRASQAKPAFLGRAANDVRQVHSFSLHELSVGAAPFDQLFFGHVERGAAQAHHD